MTLTFCAEVSKHGLNYGPFSIRKPFDCADDNDYEDNTDYNT